MTRYKPYTESVRDMDKCTYVSAHINNISFPTSIEELERFIFEHGMYNIEEVFNYSEVFWTIPRNSKIGDIVLFYHAKTANSRISALTTKVKALSSESNHSKELLLEWLERAKRLYKLYGGKIFAIARVVAPPSYSPMEDGSDTVYHWRGRIYAMVSDIFALEEPISIEKFSDFIKVSRQSAITMLPATEFDKLRQIIKESNTNLPSYFLSCKVGVSSLSRINCDNFLEENQKYRRRFLLEIDFRSYYVDYLLAALFKGKVWSECRCSALGKNDCYVDNVFYHDGKHYLLEVKLNIHTEKNLIKQLQQYVNAECIILKQGKSKIVYEITEFEKTYMYVIDTCGLYRYEVASNRLIKIADLDEITNIEQIKKLI